VPVNSIGNLINVSNCCCKQTKPHPDRPCSSPSTFSFLLLHRSLTSRGLQWQLAFRHRYRATSFAAVDDRDGNAPATLSRHEPVSQPVQRERFMRKGGKLSRLLRRVRKSEQGWERGRVSNHVGACVCYVKRCRETWRFQTLQKVHIFANKFVLSLYQCKTNSSAGQSDVVGPKKKKKNSAY